MLPSRVVGLVLLLALKGCAAGTGEPEYKIQQKEFTLKIVEAPNLGNPGFARWRGGYCEIYLKKYPVCLKHEIRHCIEGHWHDSRPNGEDC
jgi:hypothetical protein